METTNEPQKINIAKSAVFASAGALCLSFMAVSAKLATEHTSEAIIVFFRFAITALYVFVVLAIKHWTGHHIPLKSKHLGMHALRATTSTISMYSLYYALRYISLVDAQLLSLTYPLFALIFAALFFKEKVRFFSYVAMAIGFIGITLVLKPGYSLFQPAALVGLFSGICVAVSILGIRELSKSEHTYTIMFYYTMVAFVISTILILFEWHTPDIYTLVLLTSSGIFGMLYQEFNIRALSYAPARIPSSLMYLSIIFSSVFSILIWHHIPDYLSWIGIALVCAGNILIIVLI